MYYISYILYIYSFIYIIYYIYIICTQKNSKHKNDKKTQNVVFLVYFDSELTICIILKVRKVQAKKHTLKPIRSNYQFFRYFGF